MLILGIDPGYDRLGIALIDKQPKQKEVLVKSACLSSNKTDPFPLRLKSLADGINDYLDNYQIDRLVIESLFLNINKKTASRVSEVRGMILYLAGCHNIPVLELTPLQVKIAVTGYGRASKDQITHMAKMILNLPPTIKYDDEYDAIIIALAGLNPHLI